jgi:hypothetical protein
MMIVLNVRIATCNSVQLTLALHISGSKIKLKLEYLPPIMSPESWYTFNSKGSIQNSINEAWSFYSLNIKLLS